MSRLVDLPNTLGELFLAYELRSEKEESLRLGQWVWNNYGIRGVDGKAWPELYYADDDKAIEILKLYYGYSNE